MELEFGCRRIQFIDSSAYINVPHEWIKTCNLGRGDLVSIRLTENGNLEITPVKGNKGCI
jgi:hypothetical protein